MKRAWLLVFCTSLFGLNVGATTCRDLPAFESNLQQYLADASAIAATAPLVPGQTRNLAQISVQSFDQQMAAASTGAREQLCELFERQPLICSAPHIARQQYEQSNVTRATIRACLNSTQYLAAFAGKQVVDAAAIVAETVCEASQCLSTPTPPVCIETGGPCTFSCPLAAVASSIAQAADVILTLDDNCREGRESEVLDDLIANSTQRFSRINTDLRDTMVPRLDVPFSSRASAATAQALDNKLLSGFDELEQQVKALDLSIKTNNTTTVQTRTIETRLSIELLLQSGGLGISSLQLPRSAGGQLEQVREIVAQSILALQSLGEPMGPALALFATGDQRLNAGNFVGAFTAYKDAYNTAAALPIRGAP
jgi:hypothetical protein